MHPDPIHPDTVLPGNEAAPGRQAASTVITFSLLIFVPLFVLGGAIDWPASLDNPADIVLPLLLENETAVRLGYLSYLLYSVLFLAVAVVVTRWLHPPASRSRDMVTLAIGLAAASAVCRSIGIVRWPSTMIPLAERWDGASAQERIVLSAQFESVNHFGGSIGELLGVSIFASLWLVAALWAAKPTTGTWLIPTGWVVALLLISPAIELVGIDSGSIVTVSTTAISLWLLAVGVTMLISRRGDHVRR